MPASGSTRERIANAAAEVFYERGIHRSTVDDAVGRSGYSKPTLYQHFSSKDELVTAGLELADERHRARLARLWQRTAGSPVRRLLAIFDVLEEWIAHRPGFRGCTLVNAAVELPDAQHRARAVVQRHKRWVVEQLERYAREIGSSAPEDLAAALLYLLEGATIINYIDGDREAGAKARRAAAVLIAAYVDADEGSAATVSDEPAATPARENDP